MRKRLKVIAMMALFGLLAVHARPGLTQSGKKPGYVIAEVQKTDPPAFDALAARVRPTLEPFHGRFAVRGKPEMKDGASPIDLVLVWSFDSLADAEAWYNSPAYQAIIPDRDKAAKVRVMIVEGLPQ